MKHSLVIINRYIYYKRGGGEVNDLNIGKSLGEKFELTYITQHATSVVQSFEFANVVNIRSPYLYRISWKFPGILGKAIRHVDEIIFYLSSIFYLVKKDVDFIMITGRQIYFPFMILKYFSKRTSVIATVRGYISSQYQHTLKKFDGLIYWGGCEDDLSVPLVRNNIKLWPSVDMDNFGNLGRENSTLGSRKILKLAFIGRMEPVKNIEFLLLAVIALKKEMPVSLKLIGDGSSLSDLKNRFDGFEFIDFQGYVENQEVGNVIDSDTVICLTSHTENCPIVLLEAIRMGLPFIAPAIGRIPALVQKSSGGIAYEPKNMESLIYCLKELYVNFDNYRPIQSDFIMTWSETAAKIENFLISLENENG